jgi:hypothetical protein
MCVGAPDAPGPQASTTSSHSVSRQEPVNLRWSALSLSRIPEFLEKREPMTELPNKAETTP